MNYSLKSCQSFVNAPILGMGSNCNFTSLVKTNYSEILKMGFLLNWTAHSCGNCESSGGRCGFDDHQFICFCPDKPHSKTCNDGDDNKGKQKPVVGDDNKWKRKLAIDFLLKSNECLVSPSYDFHLIHTGLGCGFFGGVVITCIVFISFLRRRRVHKYARSSSVTHDISSAPASLTDHGKVGNFPGVHNFTYNELEKATNKFDSAMELGDGGFGTVYYGTLQDGRPVAVKRLYENNYKRVEQFWNEVEILAQVRHRHLVLLYGYTSRHCRELLLVYEYISNGTVADHLHGERAKPGSLPWLIRLKIAIETASALTYLHATDIIHRDVKTNNILLDENFSVKVADFGISRLFPTHVTHVSTAPQGTPGYVDPEYHECYQLTDKSDVFSFGVVLIELISSKPAVDITRHRHEINLSNMAINKIQNRALHELVDQTLGYESDYKVKTMITAVAGVAFRCLQGRKDLRPTMAEVFEALEGIESEDYNNEKAEGMNIATDEVALLKTLSTTSNASKEKAEGMSIAADEVVLLKSQSPIHSPDSVAVKWISSSATSFTSD
ncbi:hypothetical protein SLEP1_g33293 [Rubroshorea leprosula]|uniref:Protein kinase domain-containing protein n=1 Tax=Rubroshorea leprosula TaxID=152421 RepID=A0AAV5KGC4_9ROSI|nr:hypothetical protein SLEP1_g33293 [Rubroshorea leprosula]